MCWPFQTPFHKFLRHWNSLIKKSQETLFIQDLLAFMLIVSMRTACKFLLLGPTLQSMVVVQVVVWSEPGHVIDLLPHL